MENSNQSCAKHNTEIIQLDFGFELKDQKPLKKVVRKYEKDDFILDIIDPISAPVISYPSPWMDSLPKELINNITLARFLSVLKKEYKASFAEVVAYLMPRTLDAPMSHDWSEIYLWAGLQYTKVFGSEIAKKNIREIAVKELDSHQYKLLDDLRYWLYNKRRQVVKARLKASKKQDVTNSSRAYSVTQKNLFCNKQ